MTEDIQQIKQRVGESSVNRRLIKAWRSGHIKTMADLEMATYGFVLSDTNRLAKDAPVTIDTAGFAHNIYGAKLYRAITTGYNALGAVGFKPWNTNGYRTITAAASTATAGVALGSAMPATLKPTAVTIDINPTLQASSFEMDSTALKVNTKNDGVSWEEWAGYMADEFKNRLNRAFMSTNDTVISVGIESLDRVIASYAEIAYGKVADNAALDANDLDIYSKDRDASASIYDAYVNGTAFGSGSHTFELSYLDAVFTNCRPYWENRMYSNKVLITGDDTAMRITQLHAAMGQMQIPMKRVSFSVNGVQSVNGADVGVEVAAYNGVPIIPDETTLQDTISRIYLVDQDNLHIGVVTPPTLLTSDDYQALDKFSKEGVWYMEGQVVCTKFPAQGKVRDLK
jgi:hypothetical protein